MSLYICERSKTCKLVCDIKAKIPHTHDVEYEEKLTASWICYQVNESLRCVRVEDQDEDNQI